MEKALPYRRDVDRREGSRRVATHHRLERRMTLHRHDAAIRTAIAMIDGASPAVHGDGVA
jgi:hypothetical protein